MGFLRTVRDSIYSPAFYRELFTRPASASVKYFLLLALFASFVRTVPIAYRLVPSVREFVHTLGDRAVKLYPDELVLTVKKGEVSTNVKEPYFIPFPEDMKADMGKYSKGRDYNGLGNLNSVFAPTPVQLSDHEKTLHVPR